MARKRSASRKNSTLTLLCSTSACRRWAGSRRHDVFERSPSIAVLMISMHDTEQTVRLALAVGARGYIVKSEAAEHLLAAVLALVRSDKPYFTTQLTPAMWAEHGLRLKRT
jgi:DNA-binding NarL/FixJ family response regulator